MKKGKLFLFVFLFFSFQICAQSISIGIGAGLNFINGNNYYTDEFKDLGVYLYRNGAKTNLYGMGLSRELQFQINCKYSIEDSPFFLITGINYFQMRGNESIPVYDVILQRSIVQDVTLKMDIWSFQLGVNYSFNIEPVKPFIALRFLTNYFDDVYIKIGNDDNFNQFRSYKNGMRYGYSIGTGINYNIYKNIELEFSTNYNAMNTFHRRGGEVLLSSINVLFDIYYKLD